MKATFEEEMASLGFAWSEENQRWERQHSKFKFDNKLAGMLTTTFVAQPVSGNKFITFIEKHSSIQGFLPTTHRLIIPADDLLDYLNKRFDRGLGIVMYSPLCDKQGNHYPTTDKE